MRLNLKSALAFCTLVLCLMGMGCSDPATRTSVGTSQDAALQANQELLPQNIIDAVTQEKPDGTIVGAWREEEDGATVYEVEVEMPDGTRLEVEVDIDGKVLEVETADSDEDKDEDEDDEEEPSKSLDIPTPASSSSE